MAQEWFRRSFAAPTDAQALAWRAIAAGSSALVVAPTGSGKTLAAFFAALDRLARAEVPPPREHRTSVVYVSPLKALAVDVERNLRAPLAGLQQESIRAGHAPPDITVGVRTGDTPADERRRLARTPPDILITTPESLYLILTSAARESLRGVRTVIVDEVHALAGSKRGAHLALSLERLAALTDVDPQRVGLSATVRPTAEVARFLGGDRPVEVIDAPGDKRLEITLSVPVEDMAELTAAAGEATDDPTVAASIWPHVEVKIVELIRAHRSTLVFVNSRRLAERLTARLNDIAALDSDSAGPPTTAATQQFLARAHHGSVSKEQRALIEDDLKAGRLPAVVATSSLELGIDMGAVDLVIQVESPPTVSSALQRIGRAGHQVGAVSKGTIMPKHRADLISATVVAHRARLRAIEALRVPENPLDVLAQQIIAAVAMDDWPAAEFLALVRRSAPFARLPDAAWTAVLDMLAGRYPSDAFAELRPRVVWDRAADVLHARPGAQRLAVTSGGTIPDRGLFAVHLVGERAGRLGELDEEMVYESRVGDVFALGASSWRIDEITHDRVLVTPAPGQPGRMPFWHGDSLGRSYELGTRIGAFVRRLDQLSHLEATDLLQSEGLDDFAAGNLLAYLDEQRAADAIVPTDRTLVLERCRDELGDWQIVLLSPFGAAVHAPWALAIAARMRQSSGMDVQVMHADDGIVLRIPDTDDDSLAEQVRAALLVDPAEITALVTSEVGGSALFAARFREAAARALLLPRRDPGRRAPLWQQRQRSAQLLAVAAEYPSFPIVLEAMRECLQDVYDTTALREVLTGLDLGRIRLHEVERASPSPFARSLLFGYVAAFMYEGDSPLAERRAQALTLDTELLAELLGSRELRELLDADAIAEVIREVSWADRTLRNAEDIADALRVLGPLTAAELAARGVDSAYIEDLVRVGRAMWVTLDERRLAAAEDAGRLRDALGVPLPVGIPTAFTEVVADPLGDLLSRYARTHGPFTTMTAAAAFRLGTSVTEPALRRLADRGRLVAGEFQPDGSGPEWCDADVLRRIRRRSVAKLRKQAEPVATSTYANFLTQWHGIEAGATRAGGGRGVDSVLRCVDQLAGAPLPAGALESLILPSRVRDYQPAMLDELTSAGEVLWTGAGALPGGDGWVVFAPADAPELLPPPLPVDDPRAALVVSAVSGGGGWWLTDLAERVGHLGGPGADDEAWHDLDDLVLQLMWAGWLTNDTLAPIRFGLRPPRSSRRSATNSPRSNQRSGLRRHAPPRRTRALATLGRPPSTARGVRSAAALGRWSAAAAAIAWREPSESEADETVLAPDPTADPTRRVAVLAPWLLERHGVVTRGSLAVERFPGGFAAAYKVLRALEDAGGCIRTYAVDGLGAAQFTTSAVVDQLRAQEREERRTSKPSDHVPATALVLAAADPAQPYGASLPWPSADDLETASGHRPGRKAGAVVVLVEGRLVMYLERGGRSLLSWGSVAASTTADDDLGDPGDPGDAAYLRAAAEALAAAVTDGRLGQLTLQRWNSRDIANTPIEPVLTAVGFIPTPRGLRLRGKPVRAP